MSFHIDYCGQCEQAFEFYAKHLNGTVGTLLRFKDSPAASTVPDLRKNEVAHANITIHGVEIAGADLGPHEYQKPRGFYILLNLSSAYQVKSAFAALSIGGEVILPPQVTFWSSCYGIVVDQFGVAWKLNCGN